VPGQRFLTIQHFLEFVNRPLLCFQLFFQLGDFILLKLKQGVDTSGLCLTGVPGTFPGDIGALREGREMTDDDSSRNSPTPIPMRSNTWFVKSLAVPVAHRHA
jgi:hypothetical protein